jgi:hypothetical protein
LVLTQAGELFIPAAVQKEPIHLISTNCMKLLRIVRAAVVVGCAVWTASVSAQAPASNYAQAVLTNKPVAYWRLNEAGDPASGTLSAADASGGGSNGTYGSAALSAFNSIAGPRPPAFPGFETGNAGLQSTGSTADSWVMAPQPTLNTNTVTFTAWVYPNGDMADWAGILMNRSVVGQGIGFGGGANHGMLGYTWNNNNAATYNFVSRLMVPQDQWSFVAVVIEPARATLYLGTGGVLTNAVNAIAHTSQSWGGNAAIGNDPGFANARVFNGTVDEVAVFNRSLSFDDINSLYGLALGSWPPALVTQPTSKALYAGRPATFQVVATGTPPLTYQWKKNGVNVPNGGNISGSTTATLTLTSVAAADAGDYTVTVTSPAGTVTSSAANLTVVAPTGTAYEKAILGANPLAYWRLNETKDPSTGTLPAFDYYGGFTGTYGSAAQNGFNSIAGPRPTAFPGLEASNPALQATAATDQAWVVAPQPTLNTNTVTFTAWVYPNGDMADWAGILMNRSAVGMGFGFGGGANNHGMLAYTWNNNAAATYNFSSKLTVPLDQWSFVAVVIEPTRATLYLGNGGILTNAVNAIAHTSQAWGLNAVIGADPGFNNARVFNGMVDEVAVFNRSLSFDDINNLYGLALGKVQIIAPAIGTQPTSKALYAGRPASFQAVATGSSPLAYQWKKAGVNLRDGGNISGSTNATLTLASVAAADAGDYTVTVSNPAGSVTSTAAALTVVAPGNAAYEKAVLAANPLAYWRFNETGDPSTGTLLAYDYWGGFTGTYGDAALSGASGVTGPRPADFAIFESNNAAVQATGATPQSWVTAPQPALNTNTATFTAWVYPNGDMADWAGILMNRSAVGHGIGFGGAANHGMLAYTWNNNTAATYNFVSGLAVPLDQWSFVAVVIEPTRATLYLKNKSGQSSATNAIAHTSEAWGGTAGIGNDPGFANARVFNGVVDEVAVFNYALTPAQISNLYNGSSVVAPPASVKLSVQKLTGGSLQLSWPQGTLQEASSVAGPWTTNNATSPYTVPPSGSLKFYRVRVQ